MATMTRSLDPTDIQAGRQSALRCVARRDYSSKQLRQKLRDYGYDAATASAVVAQLEEDDILNESRYIERFIGYQIGRGQGPTRINAKLRALGLKQELIAPTLAATDWVAHAHEIRRKKFGSALPMHYPDKHQQIRYLQARGFTGAQIREVLSSDAG
jgi:regulatory protein